MGSHGNDWSGRQISLVEDETKLSFCLSLWRHLMKVLKRLNMCFNYLILQTWCWSEDRSNEKAHRPTNSLINSSFCIWNYWHVKCPVSLPPVFPMGKCCFIFILTYSHSYIIFSCADLCRFRLTDLRTVSFQALYLTDQSCLMYFLDFLLFLREEYFWQQVIKNNFHSISTA